MRRLLLQFNLLLVLAISSWGAFAFEPIAYTVMGPQGAGVLRWLTSATSCPEVSWDSRAPVRMDMRAGPHDVAVRTGQQADQKSAQFELAVCEAAWPKGVQSARIEKTVTAAPKQKFQRILVIADTGCRMKASENAFQDCNDPQAWPFAKIVERAVQHKPDLVVHIGDLHYRESPCPEGRAGCQQSPWGYGSDAWVADFFNPAKALLQSTPWLFVRGNHESCARAGQGWFRYLDPSPFQSNRSCDLPRHDEVADFTPPFAMPLDAHTQFVVFDSSATAGKSLSPDSAMFKTYQQQMVDVTRLAADKANSIFLSHHPLLAVAPSKTRTALTPGGNRALLSVVNALDTQTPWFQNISYLMHGHIHAFEAVSFKSHHPASFVLGNAGSAMEGVLPATLPADFEVAPHAVVDHFTTQPDYGFALLDVSEQPNAPWTLTEFDVQGRAVHTCTLLNHKTTCTAH